MATTSADRIVFQSSYGAFQTPYLIFLPVLALIGVVGIPLGLFWNKGWEMGGRPLEPWSAMVIIEIFAVGALGLAIALAIANWQRRKAPQRVVLTPTSLIIPRGMFSLKEQTLPRAEINVKRFNAGFVKQLQIVHGRRKILLSSALFPTNGDFDALAEQLS